MLLYRDTFEIIVSAGRIDTSCTHMGIMTARSLFLITIVSFFVIVAADLELVNDEDLEKLITTENFVVALFRARKLQLSFKIAIINVYSLKHVLLFLLQKIVQAAMNWNRNCSPFEKIWSIR